MLLRMRERKRIHVHFEINDRERKIQISLFEYRSLSDLSFICSSDQTLLLDTNMVMALHFIVCSQVENKQVIRTMHGKLMARVDRMAQGSGELADRAARFRQGTDLLKSGEGANPFESK